MTRFELTIFLDGKASSDAQKIIVDYYNNFRDQYNDPPAGFFYPGCQNSGVMISSSKNGTIVSEVVTFSGWANFASNAKFILSTLVENLRVRDFEVFFFCEEIESGQERRIRK